MKALARWAMDSRRNAIIAAGACLAIPLLFWLGAAIQALVLLRQGLRDGGQVVLWSLLPAFVWAGMGDPTPLVVALGASACAIVLRNTIRLDLAVLLSAGIGIALYLLLPVVLSDILPVVQQAIEQTLTETYKDDPKVLSYLTPLVGPMIAGGLAALHSLVIILCLLLGRYWQAVMFNPGGFGQEFKQLRLPLAFSLPATLVSLAAGQLQPELAGVTPVLTVPLLLAGLALFHGVVTKLRASPTWMVLIYLALFLFGPYMYTLLIFVALLDSFINFRARLKDTAGGQ